MNKASISTVYICAYGRVQGVGFRYMVRRLATQIGITGTVSNLSDGTVEILAQGSKEQVDVFLENLRQLPAPIKIERLQVRPITHFKTVFKRFIIL